MHGIVEFLQCLSRRGSVYLAVCRLPIFFRRKDIKMLTMQLNSRYSSISEDSRGILYFSLFPHTLLFCTAFIRLSNNWYIKRYISPKRLTPPTLSSPNLQL